MDFVEPAQQKLTESSCLLDLSEDRLEDLLAQPVAASVSCKLELVAHGLGERTADLPSGRRALGLARGDVSGNPASLKPGQIGFGAIAGVGGDLLGLLAPHVLGDRIGEREQARTIG